MKTIKLLLLFLTVILCLHCKKKTCSIEDFTTSTVSVNWISFGNGCRPNLPSQFRFVAADTGFSNPGDDIWMLHEDTLYYRIYFSGPNEDGCIFQFEEGSTNDLAGDGIRRGNQLEFRYKDNSGAVTCSFIARME